MDAVDARAQHVARPQRGRATRRQLREDASISPATIARRLAAGSWSEPVPTVIDIGTHERTWLAELQELLLATGPRSWLSHMTSAHLHGFLDVGRPHVPDVLVDRGGHTRIGEVRLHTTRAIVPDELTAVNGLRCTTVARTYLDVAAGSTLDELERFGLELARRDRNALRQIGELLDRYRNAPSRRRLVAAISRLPGDASLLGSPLEVLGVQDLRRHGAPPPVLQYRVRDLGGALVKRVDTAWPDRMALAEWDGRAYHDVAPARAEDEVCRARMRALGWHVEVFRRPDLEGDRIRSFAAWLRG
ncbi:MAG: hypothetical protein WD010_03965 [Nitriliruptor sp.]|uniref:hypothetical protein n=1 Tax=Nitriliruptor sp. TaxID=2448056 RepID=UPI0034A04D19